jgi:hypothetical protein
MNGREYPTATHASAAVHDTEASELLLAPFGAIWKAHCDPFHTYASG